MHEVYYISNNSPYLRNKSPEGLGSCSQMIPSCNYGCWVACYKKTSQVEEKKTAVLDSNNRPSYRCVLSTLGLSYEPSGP